MDLPSNLDLPSSVEVKALVDRPQITTVYCKAPISQGTKFGPYKGDIISVQDAKRQGVDMKFAWNVQDGTGKVLHVVNAMNPERGNWMRYIRTTTKDQKLNMNPILDNQQVFYTALRDIRPGEELLIWATVNKLIIKNERRSNRAGSYTIELVPAQEPEPELPVGKRLRKKKAIGSDMLPLDDQDVRFASSGHHHNRIRNGTNGNANGGMGRSSSTPALRRVTSREIRSPVAIIKPAERVTKPVELVAQKADVVAPVAQPMTPVAPSAAPVAPPVAPVAPPTAPVTEPVAKPASPVANMLTAAAPKQLVSSCQQTDTLPLSLLAEEVGVAASISKQPQGQPRHGQGRKISEVVAKLAQAKQVNLPNPYRADVACPLPTGPRSGKGNSIAGSNEVTDNSCNNGDLFNGNEHSGSNGNVGSSRSSSHCSSRPSSRCSSMVGTAEDMEDMTVTSQFLFAVTESHKAHTFVSKRGWSYYKCDVCARVYYQPASLKRHFLREHVNYKYLSEVDVRCVQVMLPPTPEQVEADADPDADAAELDVPSQKHGDVTTTQQLTRPYSQASEDRSRSEAMEGRQAFSFEGLEGVEDAFRCNLCVQLFPNTQKLKHHLVHDSHRPKTEKQYPCIQCEKKFQYNVNWRRHLQLQHNYSDDQLPSECHICKKTFPSEANMRKHLRFHSGRNFPCKLGCKDVVFPNVAELVKHRHAVHPEVMKKEVDLSPKKDADLASPQNTTSSQNKSTVYLQVIGQNGRESMDMDKSLGHTSGSETPRKRGRPPKTVLPKSPSISAPMRQEHKEYKTEEEAKKEFAAKHPDGWTDPRGRKPRADIEGVLCTICNKKFSSYNSMCRHRRSVHQVRRSASVPQPHRLATIFVGALLPTEEIEDEDDEESVEAIWEDPATQECVHIESMVDKMDREIQQQQDERERRERFEPPPVFSPPPTEEEYFAHLSDNIADNLTQYLDGGSAALKKSLNNIIVEDYVPLDQAHNIVEPAVDINWSEYNFPQFFFPVDPVIPHPPPPKPLFPPEQVLEGGKLVAYPTRSFLAERQATRRQSFSESEEKLTRRSSMGSLDAKMIHDADRLVRRASVGSFENSKETALAPVDSSEDRNAVFMESEDMQGKSNPSRSGSGALNNDAPNKTETDTEGETVEEEKTDDGSPDSTSREQFEATREDEQSTGKKAADSTLTEVSLDSGSAEKAGDECPAGEGEKTEKEVKVRSQNVKTEAEDDQNNKDNEQSRSQNVLLLGEDSVSQGQSESTETSQADDSKQEANHNRSKPREHLVPASNRSCYRSSKALTPYAKQLTPLELNYSMRGTVLFVRANELKPCPHGEKVPTYQMQDSNEGEFISGLGLEVKKIIVKKGKTSEAATETNEEITKVKEERDATSAANQNVKEQLANDDVVPKDEEKEGEQNDDEVDSKLAANNNNHHHQQQPREETAGLCHTNDCKEASYPVEEVEQSEEELNSHPEGEIPHLADDAQTVNLGGSSQQVNKKGEDPTKKDGEEQSKKYGEEQTKKISEDPTKQDCAEDGEELTKQDSEDPTKQEGEEQTKEDGEESSKQEGGELTKQNGEELLKQDEEPTKQDSDEPSKQNGEEPTKEDGEEQKKKDGEEQTKKDDEEPTKQGGEEPSKQGGEEQTKEDSETKAQISATLVVVSTASKDESGKKSSSADRAAEEQEDSDLEEEMMQIRTNLALQAQQEQLTIDVEDDVACQLCKLQSTELSSPSKRSAKDYRSMQFGRNHAVFAVCSMCRRYYHSVESLIRHQHARHPSVQCSHFEVDNGCGLEMWKYPEPSNNGMLAQSVLVSPDHTTQDFYFCTRCKAAIKQYSRLRAHIINCDPNSSSTPRSRRKKLKAAAAFTKAAAAKLESNKGRKDPASLALSYQDLSFRKNKGHICSAGRAKTIPLSIIYQAKPYKNRVMANRKRGRPSKSTSQTSSSSAATSTTGSTYRVHMKHASATRRLNTNQEDSSRSSVKEPYATISTSTTTTFTTATSTITTIPSSSTTAMRESIVDAISIARSRRRRNNELRYNPAAHVRRRERTDVVDIHQCQGCGLKFKTLSLLERHTKHCAGKDKLRSQKAHSNRMLGGDDQAKKHSCHYCPKRFKYLKGVSNHYNNNFCRIRAERISDGGLSAQDQAHEAELQKLLQQQAWNKTENREHTDVIQGRARLHDDGTITLDKQRGGWPKGLKRSYKRRGKWTYIKKRKSDGSGSETPSSATRSPRPSSSISSMASVSSTVTSGAMSELEAKLREPIKRRKRQYQSESGPSSSAKMSKVSNKRSVHDFSKAPIIDRMDTLHPRPKNAHQMSADLEPPPLSPICTNPTTKTTATATSTRASIGSNPTPDSTNPKRKRRNDSSLDSNNGKAKKRTVAALTEPRPIRPNVPPTILPQLSGENQSACYYVEQVQDPSGKGSQLKVMPFAIPIVSAPTDQTLVPGKANPGLLIPVSSTSIPGALPSFMLSQPQAQQKDRAVEDKPNPGQEESTTNAGARKSRPRIREIPERQRYNSGSRGTSLTINELFKNRKSPPRTPKMLNAYRLEKSDTSAVTATSTSHTSTSTSHNVPSVLPPGMVIASSTMMSCLSGPIVLHATSHSPTLPSTLSPTTTVMTKEAFQQGIAEGKFLVVQNLTIPGLVTAQSGTDTKNSPLKSTVSLTASTSGLQVVNVKKEGGTVAPETSKPTAAVPNFLFDQVEQTKGNAQSGKNQTKASENKVTTAAKSYKNDDSISGEPEKKFKNEEAQKMSKDEVESPRASTRQKPKRGPPPHTSSPTSGKVKSMVMMTSPGKHTLVSLHISPSTGSNQNGLDHTGNSYAKEVQKNKKTKDSPHQCSPEKITSTKAASPIKGRKSAEKGGKSELSPAGSSGCVLNVPVVNRSVSPVSDDDLPLSVLAGSRPKDK